MKVKGGVLTARQAFVQQHFGPGAWDKVLEALPPAHRAIFTGLLLPASWFPFEVSTSVDDAIVRVLGDGRRDVFERIGAASAEKNLRGAHRHFLTPGRPHEFLGRAPTIYGFYYDTGRREYQKTAPRSGELKTYNAETFSTADCLTVIGWHRRALEMCGARGVSVTEERCRAKGGEICHYVVRWESEAETPA